MLKKSNVKDMYSLSPMQEGMLFHYLMDKTTTAYFEQMSYRVSGEIDKNLFEQAFNHLIERYDVLRTIFIYKASQKPRQVLLKQRKALVHYEDISLLKKNEADRYVKDFKQKDKQAGFNLSKDILIRLALLKRGKEDYEIIWSFHHIIMDGWCTPILIKEMMLIYTGLKKREMPCLPPAVTYRSYIKWLEKQDKKAGIRYWQNYLNGYETQVFIPQTRKKQEQKPQLLHYHFTIEKPLVEELTAVSHQNETTINTIFRTLWGILLQKYNDTNDAVFGAVVSGRPAGLPHIDTIIGLFINTIPVRVKSEPDTPFEELLKQIQEDSVQSNRCEYIPLAEIQAVSSLKRDLVTHIIVFENYPVDKEVEKLSGKENIGFSVTKAEFFDQTHFDIDVEVVQTDRLTIDIIYNSNLYEPVLIENIGKHLQQMMEQVVTTPGITVRRIEIISRQEKEQILYEFNGLKVDFPRSKTIHRLFEEQVEKIPDHIALLGQIPNSKFQIPNKDVPYGRVLNAFAENVSITYKELNQWSDGLAALLGNRGIGTDQLVGIMMHRSPVMAVAILAVWKAGGAYIPIDPDYPEERKQYMLKDSSAKVLVVDDTSRASWLSFAPKALLNLSEGHHLNFPASQLPSFSASLPSSLAYVIYTSGSTGKPKGAMVEHIGMMNHMQAKINDLHLTPKSIVAQNASHTFDISVWQFFAALAVGGRTIVYSNQLVLNPHQFVAQVTADGVTILEVVPSYLSVILQTLDLTFTNFDSLEYLVVTGEIVKPGLVDQWFQRYPSIKMVNAYGPTEASDDITHYKMDKAPQTDRISIGSPLQNLNIYILDQQMNLCPIGVKGEIYVSGVGVGRGYLKDEQRTKQVFMTDPFVKEKNKRLYKTGDAGCWLPDGTIDFFGRKDDQVKIRGYRIQLGEIENRLLSHPSVREAVVLTRESEPGRGQSPVNPGDKYLCAYVLLGETTPSEKSSTVDAGPSTEEELRTYLSRTLPDYMIPAHIIQLEELPLTSNGKIDRKALPEPGAPDTADHRYETPRTPVEEKMVQIWSEVLDRDGSSFQPPISIDENFFHLGGHSLKAMILISRIHKQFNKEIPLAEIFNRPTIRELCDYMVRAEDKVFASIEPVEKRSYYPVSSAQNRLFILQQMTLDSVAYNIPVTIVLDGAANIQRLEKTFQELINRHESLRTSFHIVDGQPVQRIHDEVDFEIELQPTAALISSFIRAFDLSQAPLLRARVFKTEEGKHILMVDVHHIVSDGYSHLILEEDFMRLYRGESLSPLNLQYKDFSQWQDRRRESRDLKQQEAWWLAQLTGELPVLHMPTDYPRPPIYSFEGNSIHFDIGTVETRALKQMGRSLGTTLYILILTLYNVLLSKVTGQEDIIIGTPIVGRRHVDLEPVIGMFVNTLTLRNYPAADKTIAALVKEINNRSLAAFENQEYPFDHLVEKLELEKDTSRNPLFDVVLSYHDTEAEEEADEGESAESAASPNPVPDSGHYQYENRTSKFDLTLYSFVIGDKIACTFQYRTTLFKKETIERFSCYFKQIISRVLSAPQQEISGIEIIGEEEKKWILFDLNKTGTGYPDNKTIHRLFQEQAERTPDNIAVVGTFPVKHRIHMTYMTYISYKELNEKSNQLAQLLREKGVTPDTIVAIMVERSPYVIIGLLGILKAGGAYLPIDPEYPQERINFILSDSNAKILLKKSEIRISKSETNLNDRNSNDQKKANSYDVLDFETLNFEFVSNFEFRASDLNPSNLSYIIYTSGTTGRPKGVLIQHKNVVRLLFNDAFQFDFTAADVWTMFHSYSFDFSVWEMYGALLYGGKLIMVSPITAKDPQQFLEILKKQQVTILNQTPSAFYNLINQGLQQKEKQLNLKYVIFGGEALSPGKLKKWQEKYPETKLVNMFGITETTVHVTYKEITPQEIDLNISNIGTPIPTTTTYALDANLNLLPAGIPGELCVGGEGVARGYLNQPELTQAKFCLRRPGGEAHGAWRFAHGVNRVFALRPALCALRITPRKNFLSYHPPHYPIYLSGDLVKLSPGGDLEYLGRIDQQVQLRGFRIEPGEIENQLLTHEQIEDAVVTIGKTTDGSNYLCAYVVSIKEINLPELRAYLSGKLPDYMIPNYFVQLERIPLTANGKVNRKELPPPTAAAGDHYRAPGNEIQEVLAAAWQEVLNLEKTGITDNYFQMGGDSIKAIQLISKINNQLKTDLRIVDLYLHPTIEELSGIITPESLLDEDDELNEAAAEIRQLQEIVMGSPDMADIHGDIDEVYLMSDIEQAMLYHYLKDTGMAVYHDQSSYQLQFHEFDIQRMNHAVMLLMQKHPMLRAGFRFEDSAKLIYKNFDPGVQLIDITHMEQQEQEKCIEKYVEESRATPFDALKPPLWRMCFFKIDHINIVVVWEFHHAIIDGWSSTSFLTELNNLYLQLKDHPDLLPPPLETSYEAFILRQMKEKKKLLTDIETSRYWKNELQNYKRLTFPPTGQPDRLRVLGVHLSPDTNERLNTTARTYNTSLKHLCFAAYAFMLMMFSYEDDIVVGLVTNTRPEIEDGDKLLGCFLNTVPVRIKLPPEKNFTWSDYIGWIEQKMLALKAYDKCSLADIMKMTGEKTQSQNPLFDTYFNFIDFYAYNQLRPDELQEEQVSDKNLELVEYEKTNTMFDFGIRLYQGQTVIILSYSNAMVTDETAQKCCNYFEALLDQFILNGHRQVSKTDIMPEEEKKQLLKEFNRTEKDYPGERTIHRLFEEQVKKTPEAIAVIGSAPEQEEQGTGVSSTYRQLNRRANQLARILIAKGVRPGCIVGLMVERSPEMLIGILAVLKAGGGYLPIDTMYPAERIAYMTADSQVQILLTQPAVVERFRTVPYDGEIIDLFESLSHIPAQNFGEDNIAPKDLAYIIYTSGSTGRPKGVMIEHRSVVNFITAMAAEIPFDPGKTILALTTISFDIFVLETLVPLTKGLTVAMANETEQNDPQLLEELMAQNNVTMLQVTPSRLKLIVSSSGGRESLKRLTDLIVGGEPFPENVFHLVKEALARGGSHCRIYNVYGPTETTVWSTLQNLTHAKSVFIGHPIANTQIFLLDHRLQPVPIGVPGELSIGGHGLARGYINRPELTAEKFDHDLWDYQDYHDKEKKETNEKLLRGVQGGGFLEKSPPGRRRQKTYRTGDLARWLPDGTLDFLERIDHQVKIRGFRIELEEIEGQLAAHPDINEAAVTAKTDKNSDRYLAAYIVSENPPTVTELREYLAGKLPNYMIPSYFSPIQAIPLTANGKKDRKALPDIDGARPRLAVTYVEPQTHQEKEISHLWVEILKMETVGIDDNFFDLGGNSMDIMKLNSRLSRLLSRDIPVLTLFEYPTIRSFLGYLNPAAGPKEQETDQAPGSREALNKDEQALQDAIELFEQI